MVDARWKRLRPGISTDGGSSGFHSHRCSRDENAGRQNCPFFFLMQTARMVVSPVGSGFHFPSVAMKSLPDRNAVWR